MSARKLGGKAKAERGERRSRAPSDRNASRQPDRSQVIAPAEAAGSSTATAFACKPKQPAHVVHWRLATAALARTDRWRFPEVKPRTALLSAVRGSRASTDPRTSPDLLNPPKGLSMAKTAHAFLQLAMKSVPVAELLQSAHLPQTRPRETVIQRRYTLCEVEQITWKELPTAFSPVFGGQKIPRRILTGSLRVDLGKRLSNTCPFTAKMTLADANSQNLPPRPHWAGGEKRPANPLESFWTQRTGGAA